MRNLFRCLIVVITFAILTINCSFNEILIKDSETSVARRQYWVTHKENETNEAACKRAELELNTYLEGLYGKLWRDVLKSPLRCDEENRALTNYDKNLPLVAAYTISNIEPEEFKKADRRHILLLEAVRENNAQKVKDLIGAGIKVDIAGYDSETALFLAVKQKNLEILKLLIGAGANVNYANSEGRTPLHTAFYEKASNDIIALLVSAGGNLSILDKQGNTPITAVFVQGTNLSEEDHRILKAFLKGKPDLQVKNGAGFTALDLCEYYARIHSYGSSCKTLKKAGAKQSENGIAWIKAENEESKKRMSATSSGLTNTKEADFCHKWADSVPAVARPKNSGDVSRACSNLWQRGSQDFNECVKTWYKCSRYY